MGNLFSSADHRPPVELSPLKKIENLFPGDLLNLKRTFANLAAVSGQGVILATTLEEKLGLVPHDIVDGPLGREEYSKLRQTASTLGSRIIEQAFCSKNEISWMDFLEGTARICKETSSVKKIELLVSLFATFPEEAGVKPSETGELVTDQEGDATLPSMAFLEASQLENFLLCCYFMMCKSNSSKAGNSPDFRLVDTEFLVEGAREHCSRARARTKRRTESSTDICTEIAEFDVRDVVSWISLDLPSMADCLSSYVHQRLVLEAPLGQAGALQQKEEAKSVEETKHEESQDARSASSLAATSSSGSWGQLSASHSWALGLSQRGPLSEALLALSCHRDSWQLYQPTLLYRTSLHGRGISRFFDHVEGYSGTVLFFLSATLVNSEVNSTGQRWSLVFITPTGFENRAGFYGGSGCSLVALEPTFKPLRPTGRESHFVYSHKRLPGEHYSSTPKIQGVAFGGSPSKERIFLDSDFCTVMVRHHAVDRTFQPGNIVPGQGYGPMESQIEEIEVWGLGGNEARERQLAFQKREDLFKEQRGKVDLKSFGSSWEASPENMMLNMLSDPNKGAREAR